MTERHAGLSRCAHCQIWHEVPDHSENAVTDAGLDFVCTDCWLDALSPGIVTHLPYGPVVRDDTFTMNTFDKLWHTLKDPKCETCDDYGDDTWPRECTVCGNLVHYQLTGPDYGDPENGINENWMCEGCGYVGHDKIEGVAPMPKGLL